MVPCTTVAVVPAAKTIFLATGTPVEVGWGVELARVTVGVVREVATVGLVGMEVGEAREAVIVGLGVVVVRLGGIAVVVDTGGCEVELMEVGVVAVWSG
jgi:hypothetical protein